MQHQAFPPSPALSQLVRCHWTFNSRHADLAQTLTVVPDGCVNMVFHCGAPYRQYLDGGHVQQPRCFVMGQLTQPLHIQPLGDTDIFAVRFEPHGFAAFCAVAPQALRHRAVPLQALFERAGWALGRRVLRASTSAQRMPIKFRHSASVFQSCTQRATRPSRTSLGST